MKRFLFSLLGASALLVTSLPAHAQWAMTCTRDPRSSVNLRNGPSKNNYIVASIPNESYLRARTWVWGSDGMRWYNVEYNGIVGWMRSDYLCR
ncbi:MAG: SH3 domain-containing protein [bacterium]